jgi:hypothetical protein
MTVLLRDDLVFFFAVQTLWSLYDLQDCNRYLYHSLRTDAHSRDGYGTITKNDLKYKQRVFSLTVSRP